MTEFNKEPLWFGMDVDAELARYEEEDRRGAEAETVTSPTQKRSPFGRGLGAAIPVLGNGGVPRSPLTA